MSWDWGAFCPNGITPWIPHTNNLAPCFQQVCLQLPTLALIAIVSSYHFGRRALPVVRNDVQKVWIHHRVLAALLLACLPIYKLCILLNFGRLIWGIDILLTGVEALAWMVHVGFLLSLRSFGGLSPRGPLAILVLWIFSTLLSCLWVRTAIGTINLPWAITKLFLHLFYGVTLVASGRAMLQNPAAYEHGERQVLIGSAYVRFQDSTTDSSLGSAQDEATNFSKLLFYWVNRLIDKSRLGGLRSIDDLFDLPECLSIMRVTSKLQNAINASRTLFRALHKSFGVEFYAIGILRFVSDVSGLAGPLLLGALLRQGTTNPNGTDMLPYLYALGLFATTVVSALCGSHFNWRMSLISLKMRMGIVMAIYRKSLEAKRLGSAKPDILNLMSTDTDRVVNSCASFHAFWSIPFQLFATLYLLYTQIGVAFFAGVIFAVSLIPINRWIAIKIGRLSTELMSAKDARVSLSTEALSSAKQIKYLGWEEVFIEKIQKLRSTEMTILGKRKYLDALCVYFWATTPVLMCLLTFGVSAILGQPFTAATTYTTVALLNMLIGPLNAFPWVLNGLTEAWVSLRRIQEHIDLAEFNLVEFYSPIKENNEHENVQKNLVLEIRDATFEFPEDLTSDCPVPSITSRRFNLSIVELSINAGELVCVCGPTGAGKSALLSSIMGDLLRRSGTVCIADMDKGFGYVAQQPWLQRGTLRENIIWGTSFDESRYNKIVHACALDEDIAILGGDQVGIGDAGRTLSGGQRARVALARAVYQEKEIYLMDDILASLDQSVANHIATHCILGILAKKTRIIVSENQIIWNNAKQIVKVNEGQAISVASCSTFDLVSLGSIIDEKHNSKIVPPEDGDNQSLSSILEEESKEVGYIDRKVIATYWKAVSTPLSILVLSSVVLMQVSRNISDAWLAHWVTEMSGHSNESVRQNETAKDFSIADETKFYLGIYGGLALSNSVITFARAFVFAFAGIKAAKYIHTKLLDRVFYTKFLFFDITPLGRILNRFSSDTYTIDDTLPFILNILLAQFFGLLGSVFMSLYAMPWLGLLILPLCPIYFNLQSQYRHASRDIKRISSNALSPLYVQFTETLQGLTTIRAMRAKKRFRRDFASKLEESIRAQLSSSAGQQWLGLRIQFLGACIVGGAGALAAITSSHATNPSLVGLAISYALSITGLLGGVLNAYAETEQEMIAIERVKKYCGLQPEINAKGSIDPPFGWPCQGVISFKDVFLKYRQNLAPSLQGISFETAVCERIGIVGRTGAGKSSIFAALMREVPTTAGSVAIDYVGVETLPLALLRKRIAFVPQDPFLFGGTVRDNLDPTNSYLDAEIWKALTVCLAKPLVVQLGGLNGKLDCGGKNLSSGQRQLLCFSRALLKKSKVVCIDEGTANLDRSSENNLQLVMRQAFKNSTLLLIAHRLKSLEGVDRIIVVDNGRIVEDGSLHDLSADPSSLFFQMLKEQDSTAQFFK